MSLLAPLALVLVVLIPAAILLIHLLRGKRRRLRMPATFLWANLPPGASGQNRWRRPPLTLLLLLQLVAAAAVTLALTRPATTEPAPPRHLALVIDASASMQAMDAQPDRFEVARARALERLSALQAGDTASLVSAGPAPALLASGSPEEVRKALLAARPSGGTGTLRQAIALASQQIASTPGLQGQIDVFTDGAFTPFDPIGSLAAPVEFISVAGGSDNQAIVGIEVRPQPSGTEQEAYIELANFADQPVPVTVRATAVDAGREIESQALDLPARGTTGLVLRIPEGVTRLGVALDDDRTDVLALDDAVEVAVPAPNAGPRDVLLVSESPQALQRALDAIPFVNVTVIGPAEYDSGASGWALTVLEGVVPSVLPAGPVLIVNPPAENALLVRAASPQVTSAFDAAHPLLAGVDPGVLQIQDGPVFAVPPWARPVAATMQRPTVLDGYLGGRPVVVFAFDPVASGVDKSLAFPILVSNAVSYLLSGSTASAISPGQVVRIPAPDGGDAVLVRPDGERTALAPTGGELIIADTAQVGRYAVLESDTERVTRVFSVNLTDLAESDIQPRRDLAPLPASVAPEAAAAGTAERALREWWRLLLAAGAAVLGLEWFMFARRG